MLNFRDIIFARSYIFVGNEVIFNNSMALRVFALPGLIFVIKMYVIIFYYLIEMIIFHNVVLRVQLTQYHVLLQ